MSAEDLERYETEIELQLFREYRDVLPMFKYVIETERRFYLANEVDLSAEQSDGQTYFRLELTDAVGLLTSLFGGAGEVPCEDAADANDDGALNVADAVYGLTYLFSGGGPPPAPFPEPGVDPTADALGCAG